MRYLPYVAFKRGGIKPDRAIARRTRLNAKIKPYAVAKVAGMLKIIARLMEIFVIMENPILRGARLSDVGMSVLFGSADVTHKTNMAMKKIVNTQLIEPIGIVVFGLFTTDAHRFRDSIPTKNQPANGRTDINPSMPPINH